MITNWINQNAALLSELGLHFLWQAAAIAVLVWTINHFFLSSPKHRAAIYLIALGLMALSTPTTYLLTRDATPVIESQTPLMAMSPSGNEVFPPENLAPTKSQTTPPAFWIMSIYLVGLLIMLTRVLRGYLWSARIRKNGRVVHEGNWPEAFSHATEKMKLKIKPVMLWSEHVATPVVTGIFRPAIILPVSLVTGLPMAQAEAILSHELAHLRRFDHAIVFLQRVLEALFFFHPAVWFVSRKLDQEREKACDDLVVHAGTQPGDYAEALVRCAGLNQNQLSLAAAGNSQLKGRILRLLGQPEKAPVQINRGGWITIGLTICGTLFLSLSPVHSEEKKAAEKVHEDTIIEKLDEIILPVMDFNETTLEEAIDFLRIRSIELDPTADPTKKGFNFVIRKPTTKEAGALAQGDTKKPIIDSFYATKISLPDALNAICLKTGMKWKVDDYAITLLPNNGNQAAELLTRTWNLPENFLHFVTPPASKEQQIPIKDLLKFQGVQFSEESSVNILRSGVLISRNTPENLELIDAIVKAARNPNAPKAKPQIADKPAPATDLVIPLIDFRNTTLEEAVDFLNVRSRDIDPKKEGLNINIFLKPGEKPKGEIDQLHLKNVPLSVALAYICDKTKTRYQIKGRNVSIFIAK